MSSIIVSADVIVTSPSRNYVTLNVRGRDIVGFVDEARQALKPIEASLAGSGMSIEWSGEFEHQVRARQTMTIIFTLFILAILFLLYVTFHNLLDMLLVFLAVAYLWAVVKVRRRGDKWSVLLTISWLVGLACLFYFTSGALAVYGKILFSVHMVDHMAMTMVAPLFMVIGSPVTLALKALPSRTDGTRGPREWILVLVHSKFSASRLARIC